MIKRSLKQLMEMIPCIANTTYENIEISGVSIDSRHVQAGNLFIPIIGETFDGHDFAVQALESGAAAVMWQEDRPHARKEYRYCMWRIRFRHCRSLQLRIVDNCP